MSLHPGSLPPGLTVEEVPVSTSLAVRLDAFTAALDAVFLRGKPAQPWLASLREGLQSAQQVALGSPAQMDGGPSSWTASCHKQSHGDCSLTLRRVTPSRQELSFSLDSQPCLYGGFSWEVEESAYFFYLTTGPAGWTLHLEADEAPSTVLLGGSLPWTQTPSRGLERSLEESDNAAGIGALFGVALRALATVTATAPATVEPEARCSKCRQKLSPQSHQTLNPDARFCTQCVGAMGVGEGRAVPVAAQPPTSPSVAAEAGAGMKRTSRGSLAIAAVVVAVLAATGYWWMNRPPSSTRQLAPSGISPGQAPEVRSASDQMVNIDAVKLAIRNGISALGLTAAAVTCPDYRVKVAGDTFQCDAVLQGGGRILTKVTQNDDQGNVAWEIVKYEGLLDLATIETVVKSGFKEQAGIDVTVVCGGKYRVAEAGKTFECTATDSHGTETKVTVSMKDTEGNVSWSVGK
jgi:hypothetical protein